MNITQTPRNISFRVETLFVGNNNRVGRIKPDSNGIYTGLPMMVLGAPTQQKTYYDIPSVINAITNPETSFNKEFTAQKKAGEWGHPTFYGMKDEDKLARLMTVDESRASHLFTSIYTDPPIGDGSVVLRADVKPFGPFGATFKESLDDPVINTAFSLRAYVDTKMESSGLKYRTIRSLATFDAVISSGYATTDKAHAIGLESFSDDNYQDFEINILTNGNLMIDQLSLESFSDSDINEIFGVSKIQKIIQTRTFTETDKSSMERFPNLYMKSLFHDLFKDI